VVNGNAVGNVALLATFDPTALVLPSHVTLPSTSHPIPYVFSFLISSIFCTQNNLQFYSFFHFCFVYTLYNNNLHSHPNPVFFSFTIQLWNLLKVKKQEKGVCGGVLVCYKK